MLAHFTRSLKYSRQFAEGSNVEPIGLCKRLMKLNALAIGPFLYSKENPRLQYRNSPSRSLCCTFDLQSLRCMCVVYFEPPSPARLCRGGMNKHHGATKTLPWSNDSSLAALVPTLFLILIHPLLCETAKLRNLDCF